MKYDNSYQDVKLIYSLAFDYQMQKPPSYTYKLSRTASTKQQPLENSIIFVKPAETLSDYSSSCQPLLSLLNNMKTSTKCCNITHSFQNT